MSINPRLIDPRGPRVAAGITSMVLAAVLLSGNGWLLAAQAGVFALGAAGRSPYSFIFRQLVRPRLGPPSDLEDARPVQFAQAVGLVFALAALAGFATANLLAATIFTAAALVAALLNAVFGFCLGCEVYLLARRTSLFSAYRSSKEIRA